jgi:hypothetical protein
MTLRCQLPAGSCTTCQGPKAVACHLPSPPLGKPHRSSWSWWRQTSLPPLAAAAGVWSSAPSPLTWARHHRLQKHMSGPQSAQQMLHRQHSNTAEGFGHPEIVFASGESTNMFTCGASLVSHGIGVGAGVGGGTMFLRYCLTEQHSRAQNVRMTDQQRQCGAHYADS